MLPWQKKILHLFKPNLPSPSLSDLQIDFILILEHDSSSLDLETALKPLLMEVSINQPVNIDLDPTDLVSDCVAFYKGPKFRPHCPLRVSFLGQPALDCGGVEADVYRPLQRVDWKWLFGGKPNQLLFHYNQTALSCLYKMLGQIIAHSICQGFGGFPHLAPALYWYISTNDIGQAAAYSSIHAIDDGEERNTFKRWEL